MATYGCTLCWTKRNTTPNTERVFIVGVNQQTMDVTDVEGLGGTPLGVVRACSVPSGAPPVAIVAPNRCSRSVPSNTGRGSRTPGLRGSYCPIPSRRWYLLETIEARRYGGGVVSVFARNFVVLEAGVGCTDSTVHGKYRAVVC